MARSSYDPAGQLSSSCLKTLQNRSPEIKKVEQERNVCKFLLAPVTPTQTERNAVHHAALPSHEGHIQTRSRATSGRNNNGHTFISYRASVQGSTGGNCRAGIIYVSLLIVKNFHSSLVNATAAFSERL